MLYKTLKNDSTHQIKSIVCASAIGIYPSDKSILYTENFIANPTFFIEKLVYQWETENKKLQSLVPHVCLLRIGLVLSISGGVLDTFLKTIRHNIAVCFGKGNQWQSWIQIDDLISLFFKAITDKWRGIYNAVSPEPISQKTLLQTIRMEFKKNALFVFIPSFLTKIILGEQHCLVLGSQKVSAQKIIDKGFIFSYPTLIATLKSFKKKIQSHKTKDKRKN